MHLAIETTGRLGSIAVLSGEHVLRQTNLDPQRRTAATLAPELDESLRWCHASDLTPQFVSVADGPGSFTGLRIGVTSAKTLCYALELPLVAVDSLAAIAVTALVENPPIDSLCVAIDAYRGQVFGAAFSRSEILPPLQSVPVAWTAHPPQVSVWSQSKWNDMLRDLPATTRLAGDAKPFAEQSSQRVERGCDAVGTGLLAIRAAARGEFIDPLRLVPRYLKVSAAEEKAAN